MNILITGATGFTGGHLAMALIKEGHRVKCLARTTGNYEPLKKLGCEIIFGDIRDAGAVKKAVCNSDIIFNIAAVFRNWGLPDKVYYDTHVEGTRNIMEACLQNKVKKYIHCSTIGVHGSIKNPPGNEESPFNPGDTYQLTKLEAEKTVLEYYRKNGVPAVIIRPAGIYGPQDLRFLKLFKAIANKRFAMIGTGDTFWHPVYIEDLISGFILAMKTPGIEGEAFILGGPEYITLKALVNTIADTLKVPHPKLHIPAGPIQTAGSICEFICKPFGISPPLFRSRVDFFVKNRAFDISKAKRMLGYSPRYDIITGIRLTAEWYKNNGLL